MPEQANTYTPNEAFGEPQEGTAQQVADQRVSLRGVALKAVRGNPVEFYSAEDEDIMPEGYTGTLQIAFTDLDPRDFWRLQRTLKAGHRVNVSVWYTQAHLEEPSPSENGAEQLPIPDEAYSNVGTVTCGAAGGGVHCSDCENHYDPGTQTHECPHEARESVEASK